MTRTYASSNQAAQALDLVESLQSRFVQALEKQAHHRFGALEWFRDEGLHGGGQRYGIADSDLLGRASVNVSQVHYNDDPDRKLGSATAISTIVHPALPQAPSVHIHISWTEMKDGSGYWRLMADLNPSVPNSVYAEQFSEALKGAGYGVFEEASEQGDRYFFIPALGRHRGVVHFYLENFNTGDFAADLGFAQKIGEAAIDTYIGLLDQSVKNSAPATDTVRASQLAYHTLYFFQVLTLDRGTTTGLLVHNQNDIGILGSLPACIDKNLLSSWKSRVVEPQDLLLDKLLAALPNAGTCIIDDAVKQKLADAVREHYKKYPEALELQASGNTIPPTVNNHR